ncbi:hypothetical protein [Leyella stercorea]
MTHPPLRVRIGRRRHPYRSAQTSASVGADIRIGRRRHLHRSAQTSASVGADRRSITITLRLLCFSCTNVELCPSA